jgi:hypothetical protein
MGKNRVRAWFSGLWSGAVPRADEMNDLLEKIKRLRDRFPIDKNDRAHDKPRLDLIDDELKKIKEDAKVDPALDTDSWSAQWNALPERQRCKLAAKADQLFDDLKALTHAERKVTLLYFANFAALFVLVTGAYVYAHWEKERKPTDDAKIVAAISKLELVDLEARAQRDKKPAGDMTEPERNTAIAAIQGKVDELRNATVGVELSFKSLQLLGAVDAELQSGTLLDTDDTILKLRPALLTDLEARRPGIVWSDRARPTDGVTDARIVAAVTNLKLVEPKPARNATRSRPGT